MGGKRGRSERGNSKVGPGPWLQYYQLEKLWKKDIKFTACYNLRENIMKMQYRWHLTLAKLAKMYKKRSELYWRCKKGTGSYMHMWWQCTVIREFWDSIYNELKKLLRFSFSKKPEAFLLAIMSSEIKK